MSVYLRLFILIAAGWINRDQQKIIDYLTEEIRVYQELCKGHRLRFNDKQRRRLGVKAIALGRKTLEQFAGIVTPDTLLRWYVLHVLFLPFIIVIFMAVHFWRVRKDGGVSGPL